MKIHRIMAIGAASLLVGSAVRTLAIEGLLLSLQSTNVVLTWPTIDGSGATYIIRRRPDLTTNSSWTILASAYPAATGTNLTVFVDYGGNPVPKGSGGGSGPPAGQPPSPDDSMVTLTVVAQASAPMPMVKPADGSGAAVPLLIFPPGFDLSGWLILDPATGQWMSGAGQTTTQPAAIQPQAGGAQPMDGSQGGGDPAPTAGFYEVVQQGVTLYGLTNGMVISGTLSLPVEAANTWGQLAWLALTEGGSPLSSLSMGPPPTNTWPVELTVDTTEMSNGVHQISAYAEWVSTESANDFGFDPLDAYSPPISVVVSNDISFPMWMPCFGQVGNSLLFAAQSVYSNAQWYVDVYGNLSGYIGTMEGSTPDGNVEFTWDLVLPDNTLDTWDESFQFDLTLATGDPAYHGPRPAPLVWRVNDNWSGPGTFVGAAQHAWDNLNDATSLYESVGGFLEMAQIAGLAVSPPTFTDEFGQVQPYIIPYAAQDDTDPDSTVDQAWQNLSEALFAAPLNNGSPNARNFVFLGHGGPDGIGRHASNPVRSIDAPFVTQLLGATPPLTGAYSYPFRLVIIDGCTTTTGPFPGSLGILNRPNVPVTDYLSAALRPSAFVGWNCCPAAGWAGALNFTHVQFMEQFALNLADGERLTDAIRNAATSLQVNTPSYTNQFIVLGCGAMHFLDYDY